MGDTIFDKIIRREIPADIVFEDEVCLAFRDANPQAPTHVLLIPKDPLAKLSDANEEHAEMLGQLMLRVGAVARLLGIEDSFRVCINNGAKSGQTVFHLHLHILSGRRFNWPPG